MSKETDIRQVANLATILYASGRYNEGGAEYDEDKEVEDCVEVARKILMEAEDQVDAHADYTTL